MVRHKARKVWAVAISTRIKNIQAKACPASMDIDECSKFEWSAGIPRVTKLNIARVVLLPGCDIATNGRRRSGGLQQNKRCMNNAVTHKTVSYPW